MAKWIFFKVMESQIDSFYDKIDWFFAHIEIPYPKLVEKIWKQSIRYSKEDFEKVNVEWGFWEVLPDWKGWIKGRDKNTPWIHIYDYKSWTFTLKNITWFTVKASDKKTWLKFKETVGIWNIPEKVV